MPDDHPPLARTEPSFISQCDREMDNSFFYLHTSLCMHPWQIVPLQALLPDLPLNTTWYQSSAFGPHPTAFLFSLNDLYRHCHLMPNYRMIVACTLAVRGLWFPVCMPCTAVVCAELEIDQPCGDRSPTNAIVFHYALEEEIIK